MPRNKLVIERFNAGIITAVSKEDLPPDAASVSTDVDNASELGILRGRHGDSEFSDTMGLNAVSHGWITRDGGERDLVYLDGANGSLKLLTDFYGNTPSDDTLVKGVATGIIPSMVPAGKAVHASMGHANPPRWVGLPGTKQLTNPIPTVPVCELDFLEGPSSIPHFHDIVVDANFIFGIEWSGRVIYQIDRATGDVTLSSADFTRLTAICEDSDTDYIWVFDNSSTHGDLKRVKKTTTFGDIDIVRSLASKTYCTDSFVTEDADTVDIADMEVVDGLIWLATSNKQTSFPRLGNSLWKCTRPTASGTGQATTLLTPFGHISGSASDGDWVFGSIAIWGLNNAVGRLSLSKLDGTTIGWRYSPSDYTHVKYVETSAPLLLAGEVLYPVTDSHTAGSRLPIMLLSSGATSYQAGVYLSDAFYSAYFGTLRESDFTSPGIPTTAGEVARPETSNFAIRQNELPVTGVLADDDGTDLYIVRSYAPEGIEKVSIVGAVTTPPEYEGDLIIFDPTQSVTDGTFVGPKKYYWKLALGYDGYQSSLLGPVVYSYDVLGGDEKGFDIEISILDISKLSLRLSSIDVYRAEGVTLGTEPDGFYRLVEVISLDDPRWVLTTSSGVTSAAITITDYDSGAVGASFEAITGYSEALLIERLYHTLSVQLNGYRFIADCKSERLEDANHIIFRSKAARYSMFDWASDIVRLPVVPTALAAWNGRLFAFSETATYRINPEALVIEDVTEGIGVLGPEGVCVTEYGMVVVNKTNIYLFTQQGISPIGEGIRPGTYGWESMTHTSFNPMVTYSPKLQSFLVMAHASSYTFYLWAYHILNKRWDRWNFATSLEAGDVPAGLLIGKEGECYLSGNATLRQVCDTDEDRKLFDWTSARLTFDGTMQQKKVYKALFPKNTQALTVTYDRNNSGSFTGTGLTNGVFDDAYRLMQCLQLKLASGHKDLEVYSGDIIFRPLVGER
jgi:hypothetical protein